MFLIQLRGADTAGRYGREQRESVSSVQPPTAPLADECQAAMRAWEEVRAASAVQCTIGPRANGDTAIEAHLDPITVSFATAIPAQESQIAIRVLFTHQTS